MLREIDIPPLWLGLTLAASWVLGWVWPGPAFGGLGLALIGAGLALMLAAVLTMAWARTTFVPRRNPSALVTHRGLSTEPQSDLSGGCAGAFGCYSLVGRVACAAAGSAFHGLHHAALYQR